MCQFNYLTLYIDSKNNSCNISLCVGGFYWNSGNKETLDSVKSEKTSRDRGLFLWKDYLEMFIAILLAT